MNRKLRLSIGCLVIAGLAIALGYRHFVPLLLGEPDTSPAISGPADNEDAARIPTIKIEVKDTNPNRYKDGWPVLVEAAYRGDLARVNELIKAGADVNIKGPNDWTALLQAAGNGHAEVMQALIDANAFIHAENKSQNNARDIAEERGYSEIAQSLYKQGVADNRVREFIMLTTMGNERQVYNLIQKGHDPNRVDHKGRSALFYALCTDWDRRYNDTQFVLRPNIIKLLLENGADPNLRDAKGKTPMTALVTEYSINDEVFNLLIEHGAQLDVVDYYNRSLLHYARSSPLIPDLINLGLDVNQVDTFGLAPLHHHSQKLNTSAVALLLKNGADPEAMDREGRKPIDLLLPEREPGSRGYERWEETYNTLLRVSKPTENQE
jgi:ankyrin repeat protein